VPVAAAVAEALELPLNVLVVRKLGLPNRPEIAMGAIGPNGVQVLNEQTLRDFNVKPFEVDDIRETERHELARRERIYRPGKGPLDLTGMTAILVDDGIATGATIRAALCSAHRLGARSFVVAAPVMSSHAFARFREWTRHVAAVVVDDRFTAVAQCYEDFSQLTDEDVLELLRVANSA
jgi:putative phosphoribosyl transferase